MQVYKGKPFLGELQVSAQRFAASCVVARSGHGLRAGMLRGKTEADADRYECHALDAVCAEFQSEYAALARRLAYRVEQQVARVVVDGLIYLP